MSSSSRHSQDSVAASASAATSLRCPESPARTGWGDGGLPRSLLPYLGPEVMNEHRRWQPDPHPCLVQQTGVAALWSHGSCQPRGWTPGKGVRAPTGPGTNNILWGRLRPSSSLSSGGWWNSASPSHLEAPSPCRAGNFNQTREGRI